MENYDWDSLRDKIKKVVINDGVTTIGDWAFEYCSNLSDVYYYGSEDDWNKISIADGNEELTGARIHFNYVPVKVITGDINGDDSVDIDDAVLLFQHSILPDVYPVEYPESMDFNKDGTVDIDDAILLFRHSMLPDLYPIG